MTSTISLPGYDFHSCFRPGSMPSHKVGVHQISPTTFAIWVLRTSREDHNALAAQITGALEVNEPATALRTFNEELCDEGQGTPRSIELGALLLDTQSHLVTISAAGCFMPVLRTPEDTIVEFRASNNAPPLGLIPDAEFPSEQIQLCENSSVIWVSPYTRQSVSRSSEIYDVARGFSALTSPPREPQAIVHSVENDVTDFSSGRSSSEDICVFCFQRTAGSI